MLSFCLSISLSKSADNLEESHFMSAIFLWSLSRADFPHSVVGVCVWSFPTLPSSASTFARVSQLLIFASCAVLNLRNDPSISVISHITIALASAFIAIRASAFSFSSAIVFCQKSAVIHNIASADFFDSANVFPLASIEGVYLSRLNHGIILSVSIRLLIQFFAMFSHFVIHAAILLHTNSHTAAISAEVERKRSFIVCHAIFTEEKAFIIS